MHFTFFLLYFWILAILSAYGQKQAKVRLDTVAAFRAIQEGDRLQLVGKFDSAITYYQQAAKGYKAYALCLPDKKRWEKVKFQALSNHYWQLAKVSNCLNQMGQADSAIQHLLLTQSLMRTDKLDSSHTMMRIFNQLGYFYARKGQFDQSLTCFQQALAIAEWINGIDHISSFTIVASIGNVYFGMGQYAIALQHYEKSLLISKQHFGERHPNHVRSYSGIGNVYLELGQFPSALAYFHLGLNVLDYSSNSDRYTAGIINNNIGNIYYFQGQYGKALNFYTNALSLESQVLGKNHPNVVGVYINIGNMYFRQGQNHQATEYFQQAFTILKETYGEMHPDVALCYLNLANANLDSRNIEKSNALRKKALDIQMQVLGANHPSTALTLSTLGNNFLIQGQLDQALKHFEQALAIQKQALGDQHPTVGETFGRLGIVYYSLKEHQTALAYLQQGLTIEKQSFGEQHPNIAKAYNNIGMVYARQGQYADAIEQFHQSLRAYLPNYTIAGYRSLLSNSPEVLKDPLTYLPQTLRVRNRPGDDTFALATVRFADRYIDSLRCAYTYESDKLELGTYANRLYQVAIDVAKWNKEDEEAFYYSEKNKAAVLAQSLNEATALKLGGIPESVLEKDTELRTLLSFYTTSVEDIEQQCPKCDSVKLRNFKQEQFNVQQQYMTLKTRLESEFPQYFALKYKDAKISVKGLQQGFLAENPNSAILEYLLGDSVLYAFCITKDNYSFHRQKLDTTRFKNTNALQLEVKKLAHALNDAQLFLDSTTVVSEPASALYDYLIKPFEQYIKGKDLVIIPDAELNKIPYELLIKPHTSQNDAQKWQELPYLIKQHNISYHYSVNLMLEEWQKNKTAPVKSSGLLAFAPIFITDDSQYQKEREQLMAQAQTAKREELKPTFKAFISNQASYPPLPGTEREVKAIYELFNQNNQPAKYYLNDQANETTVKSINLKPYKYLHFATHGLTDEDRPTNSCLILAQNPDSTSDNLLTSSEMYGLELDAELVVLSACQTGKGTLKAGEGIIGLTRGLLYAGARNLMVSQWNVNDASTAELMTKFYSKILAGQSNRQALREAKLELLNSKFACPHYWSAFVLVGR
jgi:CHAT domain-containing protein/Tfp pilus assembly protein PilF